MEVVILGEDGDAVQLHPVPAQAPRPGRRPDTGSAIQAGFSTLRRGKATTVPEEPLEQEDNQRSGEESGPR